MRSILACLGALALQVHSAHALVDPQPLNSSFTVCNQSSSTATCGELTFETYPKGNLIYALVQEEADEGTCMGDYVFPLWATEPLWSDTKRAVVYFLLLVWCFMGVAIISDHFMAAIEVITSRERVIVIENEDGEAEEKKVLVWDETVANLTLMALGSSAPEILLSLIETIGSIDKEPDEGLGPGTIVGSAAFNLLVITAVCVAAVGNGEKRVIEGYPVFMITGFFSVFAYVWLYYVLSDELVTIGEALATFFMFPLLVFLCYAQNNNWWGKCGKGERRVRPEGHVVAIEGENHRCLNGPHRRSGDESRELEGGSTRSLITLESKQKEKLASMLHKLPSGLTDEDMAKIAAQGVLSSNKSSALRYRIDARRKLAGGRGIIQKKLNIVSPHNFRKISAYGNGPLPAESADTSLASCVSFASHSLSVHESAGTLVIPVIRSGTALQLAQESKVMFETRSGEARSGEDFEHAEGQLVFAPGELEKEIEIKILDDNIFESNEAFQVVLYCTGTNHNVNLPNSEFTTCTVTIIDDDNPGTFSFAEGAMVVRESDGIARCKIIRSGGIDGKIMLNYRTRSATAQKGVDFHDTTGTLIFDQGVVEQSFSIVLIDDKSYVKDLTFSVEFDIINQAENGTEYGEHRVLSITITNDDNYRETVDKIAELMKIHIEEAGVGSGSWFEQLKDALTVQGEDGAEPSGIDCAMHIISMPWKVIFATVPPTSIMSGYPSFVVSLLFIGLITAIVGDIAKVFACVLGVPPSLAAITFVALGTSLPDAFASKTAAENDATADNSIGNVTGSNSVNVFLGLGLPWMFGAFYKASKGEEFIVKSDSLSFSVLLFCVIAVLFFLVMYVRRVLGYGELGGPEKPKWFSVVILLSLWAIYVSVSFTQTLA